MERFLPYFVACITRQAKLAVVVIAAVCCGGVALGFVIASIWIFAVPFVGAAGAPLVAATPLAILCVVAWVMASRLARRGLPTPTPEISDVAVAAATRLMTERPVTALVAALIAGVIAGVTRSKG